MIAESMRAANVRIVLGNDVAWVGEPQAEPALAEPVVSQGRPVGKILVGARHRAPFSVGEVEKIRHYGRLITHLVEAADQQQQWQNLALVDEVTGLPNRRYLMQGLNSLLRRAGSERFRVTVLFFDLDGFKHFNDTYGHAAGDDVVRETGQLFRKCCRKDDIVARYAGDEFVVVFWDAEEPRVSGSKHPTDVLLVLRRFRKALESHEFTKLGPEAIGHITISGGLASYPWDANSAEELIEKADRAMLEAKRAGKNRIYLVGSQQEA
jgi:diguanylate cyclase (GGDEF)-like protein